MIKHCSSDILNLLAKQYFTVRPRRKTLLGKQSFKSIFCLTQTKNTWRAMFCYEAKVILPKEQVSDVSSSKSQAKCFTVFAMSQSTVCQTSFVCVNNVIYWTLFDLFQKHTTQPIWLVFAAMTKPTNIIGPRLEICFLINVWPNDHVKKNCLASKISSAMSFEKHNLF